MHSAEARGRTPQIRAWLWAADGRRRWRRITKQLTLDVSKYIHISKYALLAPTGEIGISMAQQNSHPPLS